MRTVLQFVLFVAALTAVLVPYLDVATSYHPMTLFAERVAEIVEGIR
jgi:hypothetical protein